MRNVSLRSRVCTGTSVALLAAACAGGPASAPAPSPVGAVAETPRSTTEMLRGATVDGIYDGKSVTLRGGFYEGEPQVAGGAARPTVTLLEPMTLRADLGDPSGEELVALLAETSGGAGERIYLAVFATADGKLTNVGTVAVGDRVKLRRLDTEGGTIVLDVVQSAPKEPLCCGTQLARKSYRLESGRLREVSSQAVGRLSLGTIARIEWRLVEMNGKPLPKGSQAPTFAVNGDTASGFGGCNRFSGAITEKTPGKISLGDLAATMMACEEAQMALEDEYLRSLRQAGAYTFLAGRLALSWDAGGERGLLVFQRD